MEASVPDNRSYRNRSLVSAIIEGSEPDVHDPCYGNL